jgi:hypothetical protein
MSLVDWVGHVPPSAGLGVPDVARVGQVPPLP